ncbi:MAG: phage portal protein, partial [Dietzia sp.]|nr:phage portal protein [Dietzia sp.]
MDLLNDVLLKLDEPQSMYAMYGAYAENRQPLAFISPESRRMLGNRMSRMSVNVARLTCSSMVERLRVSGFSDDRAWKLFVDNDLDQLLPQALFDAVLFGESFVLCWAKDGKATASVESPLSCAVIRDPSDRSVTAGIKKFDKDKKTHVYVYLPDRVEYYVA